MGFFKRMKEKWETINEEAKQNAQEAMLRKKIRNGLLAGGGAPILIPMAVSHRSTNEILKTMVDSGTVYCPRKAFMQVIDFICGGHEDTAGIDGTQFRCVAVDEEYDAWLEGSGKEDNAQALNEYMSGLSEEDATRLLKKNKLDRDYRLLYIPFVAACSPDKDGKFPKRATLVLDKGCCEEIAAYLGMVYPKAQVWVPGYLLTADRANSDGNRLYGMAEAFFSQGVRVKLGILEDQDSSGESQFLPLLMPFILKYQVNSAFATIGELTEDTMDNFPENVIYDTEFYRQSGISVNKGIQESDAFMGIKRCLEEQKYTIAGIFPSCFGLDDACVTLNALYDVFRKIEEEYKKPLNFKEPAVVRKKDTVSLSET